MAIDVQSQYFHNCKDLSSVTTENIRTRQVRRSVQDALQDVKETSELIDAWGTEPGQLIQLPAEQRLELAQKLAGKDKLKKLAGMLGRFRLMAIHSQKTKINHGLDDVHDMETSNDLGKVLPSELVYLRHSVLKKQFQRKFTEGQLLQYKLRGREKAGKGPIVCCVDSSGSMGGDMNSGPRPLPWHCWRSPRCRSGHLP